MRHLKPYYLFENIQDDEDLLEIKDIIQDLVDNWNIDWVDEIKWFDIKHSDFLYNIRRVEGNATYQFLIDFILPTQFYQYEKGEQYPVYKDFNLFVKQIEECIQRLSNIGYEEVEWAREGRHFQIVM